MRCSGSGRAQASSNARRMAARPVWVRRGSVNGSTKARLQRRAQVAAALVGAR
jgi:hypothetical protein